MRCMITITFHPQQLTEQQRTAMMVLIPDEQAHIKVLREQGSIEELYLSTDRTHVWLVMQSDSLEQMQQMLKMFPLYPYMETQFTELLAG